ncbi:MAG: nucleotidyltransferase family protein [Spirosomaceae bacterium]|jgi:molybdenum cofactor cytidylyltransferase|nr:nucleotidyltransferase family protein [Spirosomataceae bacterium]
MNVAIIILAAGAASRMGQPKQLLPVKGRSLIKYITEIAMDTPCYPITVVLGANRQLIRGELDKMPITVIDNPKWEDGMATSIKMGLIGSYMTAKEIEAAIFLTVDMPYISSELINQLIDKAVQNPDSRIIASKYDGQIGIPVLFKRSIFNDLLDLNGEQGAKKVILQHLDNTETIDFPEGKFDLDTVVDYQDYLKRQN